MLVRDRMTRGPVTVGPDDTLAHALRLTREHRIRHLPVVAGDRVLVGILSDRDIRLAMPSPLTVADPERIDFLERTPVAAMMVRDVVTVAPRETLEDAAKLIYQHRIGALPVVDGTGALAGILSETDILHAFVQIFTGSSPASRIEVSIPDAPGELGRVMRILGEEHGLNVVGVLASPIARDGQRRVALHVATINPTRALEALRGVGIPAGWPTLDDDEDVA